MASIVLTPGSGPTRPIDAGRARPMLFRPSPRPYPAALPSIELAPEHQVRRVQDKGRIWIKGKIYRDCPGHSPDTRSNWCQPTQVNRICTAIVRKPPDRATRHARCAQSKLSSACLRTPDQALSDASVQSRGGYRKTRDEISIYAMYNINFILRYGKCRPPGSETAAGWNERAMARSPTPIRW